VGGSGGFAYAFDQIAPVLVADCSQNHCPLISPELRQTLDHQQESRQKGGSWSNGRRCAMSLSFV
jgi:hypothetical protein